MPPKQRPLLQGLLRQFRRIAINFLNAYCKQASFHCVFLSFYPEHIPVQRFPKDGSAHCEKKASNLEVEKRWTRCRFFLGPVHCWLLNAEKRITLLFEAPCSFYRKNRVDRQRTEFLLSTSLEADALRARSSSHSSTEMRMTRLTTKVGRSS